MDYRGSIVDQYVPGPQGRFIVRIIWSGHTLRGVAWIGSHGGRRAPQDVKRDPRVDPEYVILRGILTPGYDAGRFTLRCKGARWKGGRCRPATATPIRGGPSAGEEADC